MPVSFCSPWYQYECSAFLLNICLVAKILTAINEIPHIPMWAKWIAVPINPPAVAIWLQLVLEALLDPVDYSYPKRSKCFLQLVIQRHLGTSTAIQQSRHWNAYFDFCYTCSFEHCEVCTHLFNSFKLSTLIKLCARRWQTMASFACSMSAICLQIMHFFSSYLLLSRWIVFPSRCHPTCMFNWLVTTPDAGH